MHSGTFFQTLLGLSLQPKDLTFVQISLRGITVFLATLIMVRLGSKRSMAHRTPFDAILRVILASVLSRAINGSAPFLNAHLDEVAQVRLACLERSGEISIIKKK